MSVTNHKELITCGQNGNVCMKDHKYTYIFNVKAFCSIIITTMVTNRNLFSVLIKKLGRYHKGSLGVVRIILKWILKKYHMRMWAGFIWLNIGFKGEVL